VAKPDPRLQRLDAAITRGQRFLYDRQSEDGAWRSVTYGVYRDGHDLTPHVLSTMVVLGRDEPRVRRAAGFVAGMLDDRGQPTGPWGNPVYTAANASWCMTMAGRPRDAGRFIAVLRQHQLDAERGWTPADPQHGGWGYSPRVPTRPADAAAAAAVSANVSATVYGVGGLKLFRSVQHEDALPAAIGFLTRLQNADGGFGFTLNDDASNKAGMTADGRPRSYGSATADGVRALLAAGVAADDPRVIAAARWLAERFDPANPTRNPSDFPPDRAVVARGFEHYWMWTAAHAFRQLPPAHRPEGWATLLADAVIARQREDGAWANRYTDGREDDPLVATPFALAALAICRDQLANEKCLMETAR